jgi:hypothetical protein
VTGTPLLELHLGGWSRVSRQKRNSDIDKELVTRNDFAGTTKTKISSYPNDHFWYGNTLIATKKRKWMIVRLWI